MDITIDWATPADAAAIAALRRAVAADLTERHGRGTWSMRVTAKGVLHGLGRARGLVGRHEGDIVGGLSLATRKPWAIDPNYFTEVPSPLYLTDMVVSPEVQGRGLGHRLMDAAVEGARDWPGDAIRLDAYDADAGGGGFYSRYGFTEVGRVTYRGTPLIYFELVL